MKKFEIRKKKLMQKIADMRSTQQCLFPIQVCIVFISSNALCTALLLSYIMFHVEFLTFFNLRVASEIFHERALIYE